MCVLLFFRPAFQRRPARAIHAPPAPPPLPPAVKQAKGEGKMEATEEEKAFAEKQKKEAAVSFPGLLASRHKFGPLPQTACFSNFLHKQIALSTAPTHTSQAIKAAAAKLKK